MPIIVKLPDGSQAQFPDGTPPDVMKRAIQKKFPPKMAQAAGGGAQHVPVPADTLGLQGIPLPGTGPEVPPVPTRTFGVGSTANTINPLPAIASAADAAIGQIPIVGQRLQNWRDQMNANIYGGTPQQARTDINETVRQNPIPAQIGSVVGAVAPYAAAAEVPVLAGALGFEGPAALRMLMTGGSQYAINTGDNLAHGQSPEDAARNAIVPSLAAVPFSVFGKAGRGTGERSAAVRTLEQEGVPVSAGQARGSRPLMMAESQLGGAAAQTFRDQQLSALTKAALKRAGVSADRATPEVMTKAFGDLGDKFNTLARYSTVKVDQQLQNDLLNSVINFQDVKGESRPILDKLLARVGTLAQQNGGVLKGDAYQALSSDISDALKRAGDPELIGALHDFKGALDDAVERSMNGTTKAAWQKVRRQYANLMTITTAVGGAGPHANQGLITPEMLGYGVRTGMSKRQYVMGNGDLNELSRAANTAIPAMPDSGTASRMAAVTMGGLGLPGAIATHALTGGNVGAAAGVGAASLASSLLPYVAGRAMLSPAGRRLLTKGTTVPASVARGLGPLLINGQQR